LREEEEEEEDEGDEEIEGRSWKREDGEEQRL